MVEPYNRASTQISLASPVLDGALARSSVSDLPGRRIKCLTVADDFSHECVYVATDFGISGQYVTRLLDQAAIFRGYPKAVRTDNGPEFTSRAFMAWVSNTSNDRNCRCC